MKQFLLILVFLAAACEWAPSARACDIMPRDDFLSNYEMVKKADAIVLARSRQALPVAENRSSPNLRFEISKVAKGTYPQKTLESSVFSTDEKNYYGRSKTDDFSTARPGTYAGSCTAGDFRLNADYLLFLTKRRIAAKVGAVKWEIGVQILSRDREEVDGETDSWTQAVMRYAEVARLNDYEKEKIALAELRHNAASGNDPTRFPAALVADIDRHFAAASALKSYPDLRAIYDAATDERRRDAAVYAMAAARHPQAFDLIYRRFGGATIEYFGAVRHPRSAAILAEQFHKQKALIARRQYQGDAREVASLLARVAAPADIALMMRALRAADVQDYESEVFARWFVRHPSPQGTALLREIVRKDYSEKWRVAESLAMLGDEGIVQWAQRTVFTPKYLLPVYALGDSPLARADQLAAKIIASGDAERISILVYAYRGENGRFNPHRWQRLREIAAWKRKAKTIIR